MNNDVSVIEHLELDPIKIKLMHKESGEGWSLEHTAAVEREYRRFLHLMKHFPNEEVAPQVDVDTFWHYHILDTMKYAADCQRVFGYFLHHFPYSGLRGEEDAASHYSAARRMQELYEQHFGETYPRQQGDAYCTVTANAAFCTVTANAAYCTVTSKTPFCTVASTSGFCTVTEKPPVRASTRRAAFCTVTSKAAGTRLDSKRPSLAHTA